MPAVVPRGVFEALIEPHYPKLGPQGGRCPFPVSVMLRIYCLQQWYNLRSRCRGSTLHIAIRQPLEALKSATIVTAAAGPECYSSI